MDTALEVIDGLAKLQTEVDGLDVPLSKIIPIDLVSANGKIHKSINNSDNDFTFSMRDEGYKINLNKPIYVTTIRINLSGPASGKEIKLIANDILTGASAKVTRDAGLKSNDTIIFYIRSVITSFTINRGNEFDGKKIKSIVIYGIQPEEFKNFEKSYLDLNTRKKDISKFAKEKSKSLEQKINEIKQENSAIDAKKAKIDGDLKKSINQISELENEKEVLGEALAELKKTISETDDVVVAKKKEISALDIQCSNIEKKKIAVESELEQKQKTLSFTNINIAEANNKLNNLINNVNVFSEEFSGFIDQGTKQIKIYIGLALVPLILMSIVVYNLFCGAVDLTIKYEKIPAFDLLTVFVSRLPFVIIAALIVGGCVKFIFTLLNRIIIIHQQRLDLAKIAIIAKDVSDASAENSGMNAEEIYENKTFLKMSILKSYLADQIKNFSYPIRKYKPINDSSKEPDEE